MGVLTGWRDAGARRGGAVTEAYIGGPVALDEPVEVEL